MRETKSGRIMAWNFQGLTLELRDNPAGASGALPPHAHSDYQILIPEYFTGQYYYRGVSHFGPRGALVLFHPGEVHASRTLLDTHPLLPLRGLYAAPEFLQAVQDAGRPRRGSLPFFPQPIIDDKATFTRFLNLHWLLARESSLMERESAALDAFTYLILRHTPNQTVRQTQGQEHSRVRRAREFLDAHAAQNVSLQQLADVAGLSPFYLCRVFHRHVGLPPQQYLMQARIDRARRRLLDGVSIGQAASETGFADQSHFTREFRKLVGVTPGRYGLRSPGQTGGKIVPNDNHVQDA